MNAKLEGVLPILATTFHDDGSLDLGSQVRLVHYLLEAGAHGLGLFGNASEGYALTGEERRRLLKLVCQEAQGKVPLVVSSGHTGTDAAVELSREAEDLGASALILVAGLGGVGLRVSTAGGATTPSDGGAGRALALSDQAPPLRLIDQHGEALTLEQFRGRPVVVNPYALRPGRVGMAIVAAAGPLANVVVAIAFAILFRLLDMAGVNAPFMLGIVFYVVFFNLVLAILNLIPIPPLDGANVLVTFLPPRHSFWFQRYAQYGILVLLLLIFVPNSPLRWLLGLAGPITRILIGA